MIFQAEVLKLPLSIVYIWLQKTVPLIGRARQFSAVTGIRVTPVVCPGELMN